MPRKKIILFNSTDELLEGYGLKSQIEEKQASKAKNLVYLRGKKLSSGNVSLFLDVCRDGKRTKQYLGICLNLETSSEIKKDNEETYSIAKTIVNEKNVELQKNEA